MLIPVILSGGAGTRLWPVSREALPKPFMSVGGGKSLLVQTHERALAVTDGVAPLIVTNRDYHFLSQAALADQPVQPRYLLEPAGRSTAPAVAMAALWALEQDPDACLLVLSADHLITDTPAFRAAVRQAESMAAQNQLVLFGIRPNAPETGFGYIEMAEEIAPGSHAVRRFVEKPTADVAERYLAAGNYVWNSGMFCFSARAIVDAMAAHCPALLSEARTVWAATGTHDERIALPERFGALDNISIDYAVMEKASNIAVITGDFHWSDIGSWNAVAEASPADKDGNASTGDSIMIASHGTYIESHDRLVAAIGLENMVIVDTPDALLVADKSMSQEVRQIVSQLKTRGHEAHRQHRTVARPWGTYTVLTEGLGFKVKRIVVKPGAALSLQMHRHRSEHWVVVNGQAEVVNGEATLTLHANESTYIPAMTKHRLVNRGSEELSLIEVQCGLYLGEDDIIRFEDQYGRATQPAPDAATAA
jgi:mannose-1-phosphate guanylyltransferase / mannose-6-phosphate isomerase